MSKLKRRNKEDTEKFDEIRRKKRKLDNDDTVKINVATASGAAGWGQLIIAK